VAVRLQLGVAVRGRLLDAAGSPRTGVPVHVFADAPDEENVQLAVTTGTTDGEGRFCFFLVPGQYWLVLHSDWANAQTFEVPTTTTFDIKWQGWCQLRFEIIGDDGRKIPRCLVSYGQYGTDEFNEQADSDAVPSGSVFSGEDGTCKLTVPAGIYTLRFKPPQDGSYEPKAIRQLSISADLTKTIKLPLKPQT